MATSQFCPPGSHLSLCFCCTNLRNMSCQKKISDWPNRKSTAGKSLFEHLCNRLLSSSLGLQPYVNLIYWINYLHHLLHLLPCFLWVTSIFSILIFWFHNYVIYFLSLSMYECSASVRQGSWGWSEYTLKPMLVVVTKQSSFWYRTNLC